jgi:prepilin signal peptidase PulO-like enzyme (type II secretory pathway)
MEVLISFFVFCFGLIVGSFLNVVIYRYNTGQTVGGRSMCLSCSKMLHWYELVPVFSYLAQRGKCRGCRVAVSSQYVIVELLTAIIFTLIFNFQFPIFNEFSTQAIFKLILSLIVSAILIVITVYDLRHKIIPDGLVYAFIILSFITLIGNWKLEIGNFDLVSGCLIFLFFASLWLISQGKWMGLGDAKLGIGWFLPFPQNVSAVVLSFWTGALVGILLLLAKWKKTTLKSEMPFAPFLVLGFFLAYFFNISIL